MSKKSIVFSALTAIGSSLFIAAGIFAGTFGPEMVKLQTDGYQNTRGIVNFQHKQHVTEYKLGCGSCHHDDSGTPLDSFSMGEKAPNCVNCHDLDDLHKSHAPEMEITCGQCHVDKDGNPVAVLEIQKCVDCHDRPGLTPVGLRHPKLSKTERLQYHGDAMHYLCRGCHRDYNLKNADGNAPTACNECHPKIEKQ
jgi:hypothetical protein